MTATEVGYAGGDMPEPTYRQMRDHTEVVRVTFDSDRISFERLLDEFWQHHSGKQHGYGGTQYQSLLITETTEQLQMAKRMIQRYRETENREIETVLTMNKPFTSAEMYHQKYMLRNRSRSWQELLDQFDSEEACIRSTFTARLNALACGELTKQELRSMLNYSVDFSGEREIFTSFLGRMKW